MIPEPTRKRLICRAYTNALLITRSEMLAEEAVLAGIANWTTDRAEALLAEVVSAAIKLVDGRAEDKPAGVGSLAMRRVPVGFRPVFALSLPLRVCYVARVFLNLSPSEVAAWLRTSPHEIESTTLEALVSLVACIEHAEAGVVAAGAA